MLNTCAAGATPCPDWSSAQRPGEVAHVKTRKLRWLGLGLVATAGAGVLGLTAMMNPTVAYADGEDIGLVIGASGVPIPGGSGRLRGGG